MTTTAQRLRSLAREILAVLLRASCISLLVRTVVARDRATILVYHDPNPTVFKRHVEYLAKRYTFISLDRLVQAIYNRDWSDIPQKALVVSFDDGHRGNYLLLDTLREYQLTPTIYLCSQIVNTYRQFWWGAGRLNFKRLKRLKHHEMLSQLEQELGYDPDRERPNRQALDLHEIQEMSHYAQFGAHSRYHPILTNCEREESWREIMGSKEDLESLLKQPVDHFAYPNGDYGEREVSMVKRAGYRSARSVDVGWNTMSSDPYRLRALGVDGDASISVLCAQASGIFGYLRRFRSRNAR